MRSPFVAAVLPSFTNYDVYSIGYEAVPGTYFSDISISLMHELGIQNSKAEGADRKCRNFLDLEDQLREKSIFICLDMEILKNLQRMSDSKLHNSLILASSNDELIIASDPVNLSLERSRLEVYKATLKAIQTLRELKIIQRKGLVGLLPATEPDSKKIVDILTAPLGTNENMIVISLDFYTSLNQNFVDANFETHSINNISQISTQLAKIEHGLLSRHFIGVDFEIEWNYSDIFKELQKINRRKSSKFNIILLLPNLDSNIQISSLAFLGAWFADELKIFSTGTPRFINRSTR